MQLLGIFALLAGLNACNSGNGGGGVPTITGDVQLNTADDTIAYGMGVVMMNSLTEQFKIEQPNLALVTRALQDTKAEKPLFTAEEFDAMARVFFQQQQEQQGAAAKEKGEAFLAKNREAEGIQITESGLQYKVIKEGTGDIPTAESTVSVHYEGRLIDGTVFDSSIERGQPAQFPVGGVIPGWTEALQLMKQGAKWQLFIPSDLAYGPRGAGPQIGPNETLIFDVELLEIMGE